MTIRWPAPAGSKYHAQSTRVDGQRFDSRHEAARFAELQLLVRAGHIRSLRRQVAYPLCACIPDAAGQCRESRVIARYFADFVYEERAAPNRWQLVVEDAKGVRTPIYRLKKKWFEAQYGAPIREV